VRGTGSTGSRGREQESALVTAVFKIRFPENNNSGIWITGVGRRKKVKLFYRLENIE
jgi:hypothetical protein